MLWNGHHLRTESEGSGDNWRSPMKRGWLCVDFAEGRKSLEDMEEAEEVVAGGTV